ncbi:hypothetical protein F5148DRAFT_1204948 [Russula earlei]|uniref:Uncharacterized protein n=1 Tax=Russula earlei TaxID=71964 RepID=A0ACC0U856_9AGAM|nr:hypothetical protein F5148DRAFT_1204948 [Russula earlei]
MRQARMRILYRSLVSCSNLSLWMKPDVLAAQNIPPSSLHCPREMESCEDHVLHCWAHFVRKGVMTTDRLIEAGALPHLPYTGPES